MMNSSFLAMETPQKKIISSKVTTTVELGSRDRGRFSPSRDMMNFLKGLYRVHNFQFHLEISLVDLKDMHILTKKLTKEVGDYFNRDTPDIPDVVHKLELIAVTDGYYSTFLKHYIAEEFVTSEDYSFSILTVLNYMCVNSASLADTLLEIFQLPSNESVCELCISTEQEDKKLVSDQLNFLLIQKVMGREDVDDSYDDSDFQHENEEDKEETSDDSGSVKDVYKFSDKNVKPFSFNPFDKPPLKSLPEPVEEENLSSTKFFNPFSIKESKCKDKTAQEIEPTCPHCDHKFTSKHNMKQHIISVHKITEPGMKVFRCSIKKCSFITGSRVWFERHNCGSKNKEATTPKPYCNICKETFANSSSLRRHIKRLHST